MRMRRMRTGRDSDTVKTSSVKYSGIAIHLKTLFLTSYATINRDDMNKFANVPSGPPSFA